MLRSPLMPDLSFPKTKYVNQEGQKEIMADLVFTDISIVVKRRNDLVVFATIPFDTVDSLTYERSSHPRLWSKGKKHWLTFQYRKCGQPDFVLLRLDKNDYKSILAAAEARIGKKVEMVIDN